jgi:hypothetical protein
VLILGTRKDVAEEMGKVLSYPEPGTSRLTVRDASADLPLGYSTSNDNLFPWYRFGIRKKSANGKESGKTYWVQGIKT